LRGTLAQPTGAFPALGYWFIVLAAITWMGTLAAAAESRVIAAVLGFLAAGSTVSAVSELLGSESGRMAAGYLFIIAALIAWYAASALMLEGAYKRPVLGMGKTRRARQEPNLMPGTGEPGVIRGVNRTDSDCCDASQPDPGVRGFTQTYDGGSRGPAVIALKPP